MSLTGHGGEGREAAAAAAEGTPALELLDEYWFFSNTLGKNGRQGGGGRPPMLPRSPSTVSSGRQGKGQGGGKEGAEPAGTLRSYASGFRRLLRTPSMPSPRVGMEMSKDEEVVEEAAAGGGGGQEADAEDDDLNWSSIYEGVLRTRIAEEGVRSALRRAPSMPLTSSATGRDDDSRRGETTAAPTGSTPSMSRLRHAHSTMERHCRSHTPTKADRTPRTSGVGGGERRQPPRRELRWFSANQQPLVRHQSLFHDKKWKSSSDLESIEVQGFRDLGFVFDQEELRESLADVLPGLRGKAKTPSGSGSGSASDNDDANTTATGSDNSTTVRRPYLSEAWYHVRRPAPRPAAAAAAALRLQQADARSAAEMKDQIRMWAQAVACNVRQEC
ncbi:hypothetical protein E2562_020984 [Oryza meyeriana var. granulata]|uniref:Uncharacterized protein n=1 Tax=Oryza meyeriana var. granulata TaxID=110450 RepID=A0A6G1DXM1_9ORYZ|nr:hypothetical protein E2562_020984 [Oryza meyeriana var. granulata]